MSLHPLRSFTAALIVSGSLAGAGSAAAAVPDFAWKGPASDPRFSVASNWAGGSAPASNSTVGTLTFAPESPRSCTAFMCDKAVNDLTGLSVGALSITDPRLDLTGNALTLGSGGLHATYTTEDSQGIVAAPITLGADQTWTIDRPADRQEYGNFGFLQVQGPVTGQHSLTVDTDAESYFSLQGGAEVGPVTFNAPPSQLGHGHDRLFPRQAQASSPLNAASGNPITVNHTGLVASADIGSVHLHDAGLQVAYAGSTFTIKAAGLTMDSESQLSINILGAGTTRGADYSSLDATGPVDLAGHVHLTAGTFDSCFEPAVGDSYTLISTTGPLTGSFTGDASPDRDEIYPGYKCPDASDRVFEYRYDRISMPRTAKMVVVRSTDPPYTPTATPGPIAAPEPGPTSTATPVATSIPAPAARSTSPQVAPKPRDGVFLEAAKLRLTNVSVKPTEKGVCPKRVTVTVTSAKLKATKRVTTERSGSVCVIRSSSIALKGKLAQAAKVKVEFGGKGVKSTTKTVKAA